MDMEDLLKAAEDEMVEGFLDGYKRCSPEPGRNRSRSYRHGFRNGRADIDRRSNWRSIEEAEAAADRAMQMDALEMAGTVVLEKAWRASVVKQ